MSQTKVTLSSVDRLKRYIAWRAAQELLGGVVNLGIGIPIYVADYLTNSNVSLQSENGMLGIGPTPSPDDADPDLLNASKLPVTELSYTSYFDSSLSFAMMRGAHLSAAVVGALQVDEEANLASWAVPGKDVLGVGGVMDLVVGARQVIVTMLHTTLDGEAKIVPRCTLPLTARGKVNVIVTESAVFRFVDGQLVLEELVQEMELSELQAVTSAKFIVSDTLERPSRTSWLEATFGKHKPTTSI